ncbi:MAG: hypothetical protein ACOC5T_03735 [Elusimicrobiota bacterium]
MKKIITNNYRCLKISQRFYDPDSPESESELSNLEWFEEQSIDTTDEAQQDEMVDFELYNDAMNAEDLEDSNLPILTEDDIEKLSVDDEQDVDADEEEVSETDNIEEPEGYPEFASVFQAMRWAKDNNETMRINYITLSGINIVRDVEPHGDFFAKTTGRRSMVCWDQTVNGIRSYILDRITSTGNLEKGYKFTGENFSPKFNFSRERRNFMGRLRRQKYRK